MKIIEEKTIDYNDLKWLWSVCDTQEEVTKLSNYLRDNNLVIELKEGGDRSCGMVWEEYYLEGQRLTNINDQNIKNAILNQIKKFTKYREIANTEGFKEYKLLRQKYEDVYQKIYLKK
jgi:hypothetical protein